MRIALAVTLLWGSLCGTLCGSIASAAEPQPSCHAPAPQSDAPTPGPTDLDSCCDGLAGAYVPNELPQESADLCTTLIATPFDIVPVQAASLGAQWDAWVIPKTPYLANNAPLLS